MIHRYPFPGLLLWRQHGNQTRQQTHSRMVPKAMGRTRETATDTGDNAMDASVTARFLRRSAAYLSNGGAPFTFQLSDQGLLLKSPSRANRCPGGRATGARKPH